MRHGHTAKGPSTDALEEAVSLAQHHDAVTGTAKQHVADDYNMRIAAGAQFDDGDCAAACLHADGHQQRRYLLWNRETTMLGLGGTPDPSIWTNCHVGLTEAEQVVAAALEQQLGLGSRDQHAQQQRELDSRPIVSGGGGDGGSSSFDGLGHCRLLNISVCEHTVSASRDGSGFGIVLYNPLAWRQTHYVRVPVTGNDSWTVTGTSMWAGHPLQH